ncbi:MULTISPECIES: RNA polymerase sigma factor [Gordonia]|uniref:Sigma-70 family RNA polymerase sigma factor n=1 Tax=Gordonia amicalis TaxID=89053 RepID=A0AAE4R8I3_9ACTN|nr:MULTISPECIES: sigma-70 family RNA polymerase sigma factor [Gordonia]MDV6312791.1 sigma-70 family RNA polymerase sigma factor [Gordonia amicalis]UPW15883.1 sigma-70 family RNA polymerase sigma factor [Gordonia amicalis]
MGRENHRHEGWKDSESGAIDQFDAVYREHVAGVWRYVRTRVPGTADADDVTAEVFAKAIRSWDRFDGRRGSVGRWLIGIARHVVADWWARTAREVPVAEVSADADRSEGMIRRRRCSARRTSTMSGVACGFSPRGNAKRSRCGSPPS